MAHLWPKAFRVGVPSAVRRFDASSKWLVTAGATTAIVMRRDVLSPYITLGGIAASFVTKRIKRVVKQQRPEGSPFDDPGMPSSHALVATFMAVAWALQLQSKLASISLLCASALVSVLRVVCGHHTWAQVVVGAVMGSAMAVAWMLLGTVRAPILSPKRMRDESRVDESPVTDLTDTGCLPIPPDGRETSRLMWCRVRHAPLQRSLVLRAGTLSPKLGSTPSWRVACRGLAASLRSPEQEGSGEKAKALRTAEGNAWQLIRSLWPREASHQGRIAFAAAGLVAGKALAILAPLQLGHLIDALGSGAESLPVGLLAAYGLARLSTSAFNELRSALFATVSQSSCRALARRSFQHLHSLDASYLLSSKPGALNVVVNRATKSLTQVLNMLLFNVMPIAVECAMALGVMATLAGPGCALAAFNTLLAYVAFTTWFSNHRREIMKRANRAEEDASAVFYDSLANCEIVKYFQGEAHEIRRYDTALARYEAEQVSVLHSLAKLNFGQSVIVVSSFTSILALTSLRVLSGQLPAGSHKVESCCF
ncbi:ABC transporter B family member 23 [Durusdinium trenchii]|uniref:Mitochondrial (ABC transporter ABCB.23) (AtABCB23) (ABC transporter of the mitochondrion 1) (AtATM1) (Iron-sulfur clusters transporter ATM1) (Protein STARIK 2) n=1 Tax=Durusdinium trenchii TaxID=1381693 RepID=A0ABP0MMJ1_9DINO